MKKLRISHFIMALLITFTSLMGPSFGASAATSKEPKLEQIVKHYMNARNSTIEKGKTKQLADIAVVGIVKDELKHKELLDTEGIDIISLDYEIVDIEGDDICIEVTIEETYTYICENTLGTGENEHVIKLVESKDKQWVVVSDLYYEDVSGFVSCSYVAPIETYAVTSGPVVPLEIVEIAKTQVGYKEKADNSQLDSFTANAGSADYTKYGAWYGTNGKKWCAIFVSWCANQAGVDTSIVPKYADCDTGMNKFKSWGVFHYSAAYEGNYTPKVGDIFFTGPHDEDATHTGIVVSVSGDTLTIVDGNCNCQVSKHTMRLTDSEIIGFATPKYNVHTHVAVWKSNSTYHWQECSSCGVSIGLKTTHKYSSLGKCTSCGAIKPLVKA